MQIGHFHSVSISVWVSVLKYEQKMINLNFKLYTFGKELSNSRRLNKNKKILKCMNVMGVRIVLTLAARLEFGISSFIALNTKMLLILSNILTWLYDYSFVPVCPHQKRYVVYFYFLLQIL